MDASTQSPQGPMTSEPQSSTSPPPLGTLARVPKKRNVVIFVIITVLVLIIGFAIMLVYQRLTESNRETPTTSTEGVGEYLNPFLGTVSYQNPFSTYKNPFDNLK